jgi:hypothetical protein
MKTTLIIALVILALLASACTPVAAMQPPPSGEPMPPAAPNITTRGAVRLEVDHTVVLRQGLNRYYRISLYLVLDEEASIYRISVTHPDFAQPYIYDDRNEMEMSSDIHLGDIFIQRSGGGGHDYFWVRFPRDWEIISR